MHYAQIKYFDVNNGPGIRVSLFVSGCRIHCPDCFNKCAWDFDYGKAFTDNEQALLAAYLAPPYVSGISVLGGEPFEYENQICLVTVLRELHRTLPDKTVWCFTGYILDKDILPPDGKQHFAMTDELLSYIDVLVDGPFVRERKLDHFDYRGSDNQRIIDVPNTLVRSAIVLLRPSDFPSA